MNFIYNHKLTNNQKFAKIQKLENKNPALLPLPPSPPLRSSPSSVPPIPPPLLSRVKNKRHEAFFCFLGYKKYKIVAYKIYILQNYEY